MLVHDPRNSASAAALEPLYRRFTHSRELPMRQCLVLACSVAGRGGGLASRTAQGAGGIAGPLAALPQLAINVNSSEPDAAARKLRAALDDLVQSCLATQARRVENEIAEDLGVNGSDSGASAA